MTYTDEQVQQMISQAMSAHSSAGYANAADIERIVNEALTRQDAAYKSHIAGLQAQVDAMRTSNADVPMVPAHGGGSNTEIAETWSQWEQERSRQHQNTVTEQILEQLRIAES